MEYELIIYGKDGRDCYHYPEPAETAKRTQPPDI